MRRFFELRGGLRECTSRVLFGLFGGAAGNFARGLPTSPSKSHRRRVGRVTVYARGRRFWVYYPQGGEVIRRAVGADRSGALSLAARINAELAEGSPTSLAFRPVEVVGLIAKWLDRHEQVWRSSLVTVRRYRTAIQHLGDFVTLRYGKLRADRFTSGMAEEFVRHLRTIQVASNIVAATRPVGQGAALFNRPSAAPQALHFSTGVNTCVTSIIGLNSSGTPFSFRRRAFFGTM